MLAANELLTALASTEDAGKEYKDCNNDYDFGAILDFYGSGNDKSNEIMVRYSDGSEGPFKS